MASGDSFEILYFNTWGRVDVTQMILEYSGVPYENKTFDRPEVWPALKSEQKFGKVPRLSIKSADGTVKHLWESSSIELYLAERFSLLPSSPLERAEVSSVYFSILDLKTKITTTVNLPSFEERGKTHAKHIAETVPGDLKWHEKIIEKNGGTYYYGDKVTLPDLAVTALYLRFKDTYGAENPINATNTPKIAHLVETILKGKVGEWAKERRDSGYLVWNKEEYCFKRPVSQK